jgi:hypothetical protein
LWNAKFKRRYVECDVWRGKVLDTIAKLKPKLVILSSATLHSMMHENASAPAPDNDDPELYKAGLRKMIEKLLGSAGKVMVIKDTPALPMEPLECLYRNPGKEENCSWAADSIETHDRFVPDIGDLGEKAGIVNLNTEICPQNTCRAVVRDAAVFYDQTHITASFSKQLAGSFERLLSESGM